MIEKWEEKYADVMEHEIVTSQQIQRWQDEELELLRAEVERLQQHIHTCGPNCQKAGCVNTRLHELITKLHTSKGRYHTQLAACDLFDAVGLKNERPAK